MNNHVIVTKVYFSTHTDFSVSDYVLFLLVWVSPLLLELAGFLGNRLDNVVTTFRRMVDGDDGPLPPYVFSCLIVCFKRSFLQSQPSKSTMLMTCIRKESCFPSIASRT